MTESPCVLVVEDEQDIRELLAFNLQREGYRVAEAGEGRTALELAATLQPDLVLLDLMLPGMDGFAVCRGLKRNEATAHIPVVMLTARGEEMDRILGLELGADDYVVKPFNVRELLLRMSAILRRQSPPAPSFMPHAAGPFAAPVMTGTSGLSTGPVPPKSASAPGLACHGVAVDVDGHRVSVNGENVDLTATEFRLLEDLLTHPGKVRTREELLSSVWGYQFEGYARTVDTHVRRLRAKLGAQADIVETVRGVGYRCKD